MKNSHIKGLTAFITGASSGIGKACAQQFAALGINLVIAARRLDRLKSLAQELSSQHGVDVFPIELDIRSNDQVESAYKQLEKNIIEVSILVNNAGLALTTDKIQSAKVSNWDIMIDTNLKGLLYATHVFLPGMIKRNQGHIVNIGSVAGHGVYQAGNVYSATKHAVRAISKSLRLDLIGTAIRVSEVAPGAVDTEFSEVRWQDKERARKMYEGFQALSAEDIADAVVYCVTRPQHVNVAEIVVFPQAQASLTEIYRGEPVKEGLFDFSKKK